MLTVLKWSVISLVLVAGSVLLLNCFDQELRPEVAAYAEPVAAAVPPEQNAFYAMLGISAPAGTDPHAFGLQVADRFEIFQRDAMPDQAFDVHAGVASLGLVWDRPVCTQWGAFCLDEVAANEGEITRALADNPLLLERYLGLYDYPRYADPLTPHLSAPIATGSVLPTHALWLAGEALRARSGQVDVALAALRRDVQFWRRMARQPAGLIHKVVTQAAMTRDIRLVSDLIRSAKLDAGQLQTVIGMLASLDEAERDLTLAFREEFRMMHVGLFARNFMPEGMVNVPSDIAFMRHPFFLRNATSNRLYRTYQDYEGLASLPAPEYLQQRDSLRERHQSAAGIRFWRMLYNPVGSILLGVAVPDLGPYPGRVHDLEGLIRLVNLQASMRARGITSDAVAGFVAASDGAHANPYTGRPMQWDPEQRQLFFVGHGRARGERISVRL